MNTDERIEALTHSVELLSQMHQDNEKRYSRYFESLTQSLTTLTRIAESHENRITNIERNDKN